MASQTRYTDKSYSGSGWNNVDNVSDGDNGSCADAASSSKYHWWELTNGNDFSIPTGSTIDGLEIEVKHSENDGNDYIEVQLNDDGADPTKDLANVNGGGCSGASAEVLGSPTDDWGGTWTVNGINNYISVRLTSKASGKSGAGWWVDYIKITVYYTPPGGDVNVNASVANLTLTEQNATVNAETNVNAGVDALTLTTYPATVDLSTDTNVNASVVNLTLTEQSATVNAETNVQAGVDALTLAEQAATVNTETNVQAGVDALTLTTYAATVSVGADVNVLADVAVLTLTAYQCTVNAATNIQVAVDPLILSVLAATVSLDISIAASVDALMLTNYQASVIGTAAAVSPDGAAKVVAYAPPPATVVQGSKISKIIKVVAYAQNPATVVQGSRIPRIINDPRTPKIVKK
jgi:hypothetical protein